MSHPTIQGKAKLEALGGGRFRVSGVLDATTAADLLAQSEERFANEPRVCVDLGGVSEGDSSGLALLIEWLRVAQRRNQPIEFLNLPAQVSALARISEVEDLLVPSAESVAQAS